MTVLWLIVALAVIAAGAELVVRGASKLALRLGLSPLFVGLAIVGFGTSSPELAASLVASVRGITDVSVGNVVGSNIFNIGVIAGVTALLCPIRVQLSRVRRDLSLAIVAAMVPWIGLLFGRRIVPGVGVALLIVLATYLVIAYRAARTENAAEPSVSVRGNRRGVWLDGVYVVVGLALLVFGARMFVTAAVDLARSFGVSEVVIGLTVVAAGTSLPELVTSVVAALRRKPEIALGNIIGSNIFNSFGVLGASSIVRAQALPDRVLAVDVPVVLIATLALLPIMKTGGMISRREGALLLCGYAAYLFFVLGMGGG